LKRFYLNDTKQYLQSGLIKLITGPRRVGKSVFALQMLSNQNFAYLNFDDELLLKNFDEDQLWQNLLEVYPNFEYLLLDEIQNLQKWDLLISKLYRRGINLIITGSNANLLSNEMSSLLTGRYLQISILPFSFLEYAEFKKIQIVKETPTEMAILMNHIADYLKFGGFPETILMQNLIKNYLSSLMDSVLLKDITKRYNIRKSNDLYNLADFLITNYCNQFSLNSLSHDIQIGSLHTTQKFCKYLEDTLIYYYLPRYNSKLKWMQKAPQKVYIVDNGIIFSKSFEQSQNWGRLLENLVFIELKRRGFSDHFSLFYYITRNNKEVDFVCRKGHQIIQLIQVSYTLNDPKTLKRELTSLIEASQELNCKNLVLLTWNEKKQITEKNYIIEIVPINEFLMYQN
jgi:uncharacterized protein